MTAFNRLGVFYDTGRGDIKRQSQYRSCLVNDNGNGDGTDQQQQLGGTSSSVVLTGTTATGVAATHLVNHGKAFACFSAAVKKQAYAPAILNLAKCYATGKGVVMDKKKAVELLTRAAGMKHAPAMCQVMRVMRMIRVIRMIRMIRVIRVIRL